MEKEILEILKSMKNQMDTMQDDIKELKVGQNDIKNKVDNLESKVDTLESKVDNLESKVDNLEKGQQEIKSMFPDLEGKYGSKLVKLPVTIDRISDNVDLLAQDIKFIKHKLNQTEEDVFNIKDHLKIVK